MRFSEQNFNIKPMKRILTSFLLALVGSLMLFAERYTPETVPNPRVVDSLSCVCNPDSILTVEEVMKLERICAKIDSLSEVELAVVALHDIGDAEAFDFALELFNHWGVGNKVKNTGVMLFLTTKSRQVQIITGDGIEGLLPDGECSLTIDEMIDDLKVDKFGAALITGAKSIGTKVTTQEAREELLLDNKTPEPNGLPWSGLSNLLTVGLGVYGFRWWRKKKCPKCSKRSLKVLKNETVCEATFSTTGKGVILYRCEGCGHTFEESYVIPKKVAASSSSDDYSDDGYSGGGFSSGRSSFGGGGGSFGGGHSSGGGAGRSF